MKENSLITEENTRPEIYRNVHLEILNRLNTLKNEIAELIRHPKDNSQKLNRMTIGRLINFALIDLEDNQRMTFPTIIDFNLRYATENNNILNSYVMRFCTAYGTPDLCLIKKSVAKIHNQNVKEPEIIWIPQREQKEIRYKTATDEDWERYAIQIVDRLIRIESKDPKFEICNNTIGGVDILRIRNALYYNVPISHNGSKPT